MPHTWTVMSTATTERASAFDLDEFLSRSISTYRFLNQDQIWFDIEGNEIRIEDMAVSYKRNVLRFLTRRARSLAYRYATGAALEVASYGHMGEMARDSVETSLDEDERFSQEAPTAWLQETRFGARLVHDINHRIGGHLQ